MPKHLCYIVDMGEVKYQEEYKNMIFLLCSLYFDFRGQGKQNDYCVKSNEPTTVVITDLER